MKTLLGSNTTKNVVILVFATVLSTLLVWFPHIAAPNHFLGLNFENGFGTIYRNFDGLEYVIIAKSWYNPAVIASLPQQLPAIYYAAHFPGYSLAIAIFAPLMGFLKSMLFVSVLFTTASVVAFYFMVRDFKFTNNPLVLSLIFLVIPARWLVVRSVGSAEPMFIFFVIASLYYFMKYEASAKFLFILLAAVTASMAQLTRPPGILLFIALGLYVLWKLLTSKVKLLPYFSLLLVPATLIGVFYWFYLAYGNLFAYFNTGDNIHLGLLPFRVFNKNEFWVGDIWLEDLIYIFLLSALGTIYLFKQKLLPVAFFSAVYLAANLFVSHRDISRYMLPIFPFILIGFEKVLTSKEFRLALAIVALAVYLYAQNFMITNTAPIPNVSLLN